MRSILGWLTVAVFTGAVEIAARAGLLTAYFPPPSAMFAALVEGLVNGPVASQTLFTLQVYLQGFAISLVLSVGLGLIVGTVPAAHNASRILLDSLRSVPSVSLVPLAILMFGLQTKMQTSLVIYSAFWPSLINTLYAVRNVDPLIFDTARVYGVPKSQMFWRVTLPAALPGIATGARISSGIALLIAVSAGIVGGVGGIGYYVMRMQLTERLPEMYSGVMLAGILGYCLNVLFSALERKAVFWAPDYRRR